MNNIPTAEEFLLKSIDYAEYNRFLQSKFEKTLKEFAKLHVKAALEAASDKAVMRQSNYKGSWTIESRVSLDDYTDVEVDKKSILNAYPEENIK